MLYSSAQNPSREYYTEEFLNMQSSGASVEIFLIITGLVYLCIHVL